jgi:hypothetical protein
MQIYNRERCTVLQILRIQLCFGGCKFRLLASLMRHQIITFATIKLTIDAGKSSNKIVIFISNFASSLNTIIHYTLY